MNLGKTLALFLGAVLAAGPAAAADFVLVRDGKSAATVVAKDKSCETWAKELVSYVEKSSGARLAVAPQADGPALKLEIAPDKHADLEEFTFTFPDERTMLISGGSENGLRYGVYEFLSRCLGLRRLFPGELGDHLPKHSTVAVPRTEVKMAPKYLSRYLGSGAYTAKTKEFYDWSRSLGANNPRIWIRHFLAELLPVEKYGKLHPEFYPEFHGKRTLPAPGQNSYWQPCFTAPGLAEALAADAIEFLTKSLHGASVDDVLKRDPRRHSVALGINDASGFCECEACRKANGTRTNFVGRPDHSGSYVPLISKVADLVTAKYPRAKVPFLAYNTVTELPPGAGKLNPALVPAIAFDSMYLADPERKAGYRKLVEAWHKALPELGVWDYIWGGAYVLPRVFNHMMADYLRWNYHHGVVHYYSEFAPGADWTEGPKAYLILKLLWDPDRDPDAILDDWYKCAVGEKAAPYLKEYFDDLEKFWTTAATATPWFKRRQIYSSYGQTDYLAAYTPEALAKSENLLKKTVELAGTPEEKARAEYFLKLFRARKPVIEGFWQTRAVIGKVAKLDFSDPVYRADFDPTPKTLPTWQRKGRNAKFFRDETGGVGTSSCIGIDADGSVRAPATYEARIPVKTKRVFRATVQCRAEGKVGPDAAITLTLYWRDARGKHLGSAYTTKQALEKPYDDFWRTLTVYTETPALEGPLQLCMGMNVSGATRGKVRFDNLAIDATAEAVPDEDKFTRTVADFTFDKPPRNFSSWHPAKAGKVTFFRDAKGGRKESAALGIDFAAASANSSGMYVQDIPFTAGTPLLVQGYIKLSANTPARAVGQIALDFRDSNKKTIKTAVPAAADYPAVRDGKWRRVFFVVTPPEGTQSIRLVLTARRAEPGRILFDDISIRTRENQ